MSDIWRWIQNKHHNAYYGGNETELQMMELFWKMLNTMEGDPQSALSYCRQARRIAELLDDKWFIQLLNHWELQMRYSFIGDFTGTLELATKATVEVRLPEYQTFPQRICLHEDLISGYAEQDPIGNQDLVKQALDYMEQEVDPKVDCFICLNSLKLDFVRTTSTTETTIQAALKSIPVAERSEHHLCYVYIVLVESAYQLKQWDNLLTWAIEAESNARKAERDRYLASATLWLALYAEHIGDTNRAKMLFEQAQHRANRYGAFLGKAYYTALTQYHEHGGRLQEALDTQVIYLELLIDKSKPFGESLARLEIIRLKKALSQPYNDDIAELKETIKALKAPEYILDKLQGIVD